MTRAQLRARLAAARAERRRARRKRAIKLILFMILLWLLLRRCDTALVFMPLTWPVPGVSKSVPTATPASVAPTPRTRPKAPKPALRRVKTAPRAQYTPEPSAPAPWLSALRLQVAARAPRLARCFEGEGEPGALTWTTSLDPSTGVAGDHAFEPRSGGLAAPVKACLTAVLSAPRFDLGDATGPRTRVALVIEF